MKAQYNHINTWLQEADIEGVIATIWAKSFHLDENDINAHLLAIKTRRTVLARQNRSSYIADETLRIIGGYSGGYSVG